MSTVQSVFLDDELAFDRDLHSYTDKDGVRCLSVTQAIKISGLIDYSMVPPDVLAVASSRGQMVHHACAVIDRGDSLEDYEIPEEVLPYIDGYLRFLKEMRFIADPDWVEKPMIVELFGHRVGMMPDAVGAINGIPTLIERKATAAAHPAWKIQTAGYERGLYAAGLQIRQRCALQLHKTGRYTLHPHEDNGDLATFAACFHLAAWKLKHRLAELD